MDHYAPTHDLVRPWRIRTLIATGIAAVELLALVAVGVAILGKGWFTHARASAAQNAAHRAATAAKPSPARAATPSPAVTLPARPLLPRARTPILVLNGNGQDGAAGAEARLLRMHDYPIAAVGNAKRADYGRNIAMYLPGYGREARRLARDERIAVVTPLDGVVPGQLKGAKIVLIVGS